MNQFIVVVGGGTRELADFAERSGVRQQLDSFPDRELAPLPLLGNAGFPAHLFGQRLPALEFLDFGLPDHVTCSR